MVFAPRELAATHGRCTCKKLSLSTAITSLLLRYTIIAKKEQRRLSYSSQVFEACSTVAEVLLTDTPPAELNIFCFITASSMLPLSNSPTINTTQSVKNIFFFCRCGNLHCYSSAVLNLENPKKASVVEHKQLQKGSCCSEADYGTDGKAHSLSHCGPSLTASMQKAGKAS